VLHLLPFAWSELVGRKPLAPSALGRTAAGVERPRQHDVMAVLHRGFYPRLHGEKLEPGEWLPSYVRTYLERDVRSLTQVGDLEAFGRFLRLCAGRNAQLLNLSSLAVDAGVTHTTVKRWLSILEASFLVLLLRPHSANYGKRLIKSPKLHFLDTGLLCALLRIRSPAELEQHSARGAIFETYVVSEMLKGALNRGEEPDLHFWRDSTGHEVDLIVDAGARLVPVEVKAGMTLTGESFRGLEHYLALRGEERGAAALVYAGDQSYVRRGIAVYPWWAL
jgi:uncharacterized protein